MTTDPNLLDDLEWRGLIAHSTDLDALRTALTKGPVKFYVGFDPTAPSLHMGHLVQVLTARRLQEAGHIPYALVGGATGMIGDPWESGERTLNSLDVVKQWVERVRGQIEPFLSFDGANAATMVNNYDWTASLSTIDFLRDIGKHFPVNRMLAREVVRTRLEAGISYTEFSYVLLQSMDFLNLYRDHA
ncbi:MAG: tyrosine--tRNA ligase, partial [Nocardioides sp.]